MCLCPPSVRTRPRGHTNLFVYRGNDSRQSRTASVAFALRVYEAESPSVVHTQGVLVPTAVGRSLNRAVPTISENGRVWHLSNAKRPPRAAPRAEAEGGGVPGISAPATLLSLRPVGKAVRSLDPPHPSRPRDPPHSPLSSRTGSPSAAIFSSAVQTHRK